MNILKKAAAGAALTGMVLLAWGCSQPSGSEPGQTGDMTVEETWDSSQLIQVRFPESLFTFTGMTVEEIMDSYEVLGKDYYTEIYAEGNTLVLEGTKEQIQRQIDENNAWVEELTDEFLAQDPQYAFEGDPEYTSAVFFFDEYIDTDVQSRTLLGITSMYATNYILSGNSDWTVNVTVKNCHTGLTVAQALIPEETLEYGPEEWEDSYGNE